jgi:hypothetical protein
LTGRAVTAGGKAGRVLENLSPSRDTLIGSDIGTVAEVRLTLA